MPDDSETLRSMEGLLDEAELGKILKIGLVPQKNFAGLRPEGFAPFSHLDDKGCEKKPSSWKLTGVRFAPFESEVPGPKATALEWASSKSLKLDREVQLRLVFVLACMGKASIDEAPQLVSTDNTMHVIYNLSSANEAFKSNLKLFVANSLSNKSDEAQGNLEAYARGLASNEIQEKRKQLFEDWNKVLTARFQDNHTQKSLDQYRNGIESFIKKKGNKSAESSQLPSNVPSLFLKKPSSHLRTALGDFIKRHAEKQNLTAIATMFTAFGPTFWEFRAIPFPSPGVFPENASTNRIFTSFVENGKLKLAAISQEESFQDETNFETTFKNAIPNNPDLKKRFEDQLPFFTFKFSALSEDSQKSTLKQNQEADLFEPLVMEKLFDQKFNNPTSAPCTTCHLGVNTMIVEENGKLGLDSQQQFGWGFQIMGRGGFAPELNLRTLSETKHEALEANAAFGGYSIPAGTTIEGEQEDLSKPAPSNFSCTTIDPSDSFVLIRGSMDAASQVRGSLNTGISLKVSGPKSEKRFLAQQEAFIHKSVVTCSDKSCKNVTVKSNSDDIAVKDSTGKVHFKGSNVRATPGGKIIGLVAPGVTFPVLAPSGDAFKILFSGFLASSRCK